MENIKNSLAEIKEEMGTNLLMVYASFSPEWKWFADETYSRLKKKGLRQMGEMGRAELAVKLADFLRFRTKLPEE